MVGGKLLEHLLRYLIHLLGTLEQQLLLLKCESIVVEALPYGFS